MPRYPQSDLIRKMFHKGQPVAVGRGEVVLGNGHAPNGIYYIDSGYIKVYTLSKEGEQYLTIIYGSGEIFPMVWAYLGVKSTERYYEALSDCLLWRMSKFWFNEFLVTRHDMTHAMSLQLAQQFRVYTDRVDNLEYKKASERVAYRLLYLASRFGIQKGRRVTIDPPITHEIVASSINLARESVSRELEKLEHERIIKSHGRQIVIFDVDALANKIDRQIDLKAWYMGDDSA